MSLNGSGSPAGATSLSRSVNFTEWTQVAFAVRSQWLQSNSEIKQSTTGVPLLFGTYNEPVLSRSSIGANALAGVSADEAAEQAQSCKQRCVGLRLGTAIAEKPGASVATK